MESSEESSTLFSDSYGVENANSRRNKVELEWQKLNYSVSESCWKFGLKPYQQTEKKILKSVSGKIESESLTAVIGPSGGEL